WRASASEKASWAMPVSSALPPFSGACCASQSRASRRNAASSGVSSKATAVLLIELLHAAGILAEELRQHVRLDRHVRHVGHTALEREPHREVAGIDDIVRATRVGVVDDRLGVVLRCECTRAVVQVRPLEHQLDGQVLPWLTSVSRDEDEIG